MKSRRALKQTQSSSGMNPQVRAYLAEIGRRGGRKSSRKLDPETARKMALLREARKVYREYHAQCFWSYDPNRVISLDDVKWVGTQLLKHGGMKLAKIGAKLCR